MKSNNIRNRRTNQRPLRTIALLFLLIQLLHPSASHIFAAESPYVTWGSATPIVGFGISNEYGFEPNPVLLESVVNYMADSRHVWTNSGAGVNASVPKTGNNMISIANKSESWYGVCTRKWFFGYSYQIDINYRTIKEGAQQLLPFIRSVTVHELGHVFSLSDTPGTTASIMSYSRNRNSMTSPQSIDVTRVKNHYQ